MKFPTSVTPEEFERWLWRLAIIGVVSPILTAIGATLFSQDRVFLIIAGVLPFAIGLILMRASFVLKRSPQQAFWLIEWGFYLTAACMIISNIHWYWTNPGTGLLFAFGLVVDVIVLLWIKEAISHVRKFHVRQ